MNFIETIKEKARLNKQTIVLAEGEEIRTITAANALIKEDICNVVLLGNENKIKEIAGDISLDGVKIINPETSEYFDDFKNSFFEMRKAKGMTEEKAEETMKNILYFGVMMVEKGIADGMVAGAVNSTGNV